MWQRSQESHHQYEAEQQLLCIVLHPDFSAAHHLCKRPQGGIQGSRYTSGLTRGTPWRASVGLWRNDSHGLCKSHSSTHWPGCHIPLEWRVRQWNQCSGIKTHVYKSLQNIIQTWSGSHRLVSDCHIVWFMCVMHVSQHQQCYLVSLEVVADCFLRLSSWQRFLVPQSTPHCPCWQHSIIIQCRLKDAVSNCTETLRNSEI